jgi:hypothetical protein
VKQSEINFQIEYSPPNEIGYGVERSLLIALTAAFFVNYSQGFKGLLDSDFQYEKYSCTTSNLLLNLGSNVIVDR